MKLQINIRLDLCFLKTLSAHTQAHNRHLHKNIIRHNLIKRNINSSRKEEWGKMRAFRNLPSVILHWLTSYYVDYFLMKKGNTT